jgi:hypothetical protein
VTHDLLFEMVDLYALRALAALEESDLEHHMASCPLCQIELDAAIAVAAALIPDSAPPIHLWDRVVAELESFPSNGL